MDIYLLQIIGDWLSVLFVSFISFLGIDLSSQDLSVTESNSNVKSVTVLSMVVPYSTDYVFNDDKIQKGDASIIKQGENGINYVYDDGTVKSFIVPVNEVREVYNGTDSTYTGRMTGYGPDCDTCDGIGGTACRTKYGKNYNLITDGIYYNDDDFGKVRIVAAPFAEFPCGTIVYVDNGIFDPFYAVVLDTGYSMRNGYENGIIWFDLAFSSEKDPDVPRSTSYNTTYKVQRWGW